MQLLVWPVELCSYDMSFSTTRIVPSKSGSDDKNQATDVPMTAPPTMTTSYRLAAGRSVMG